TRAPAATHTARARGAAPAVKAVLDPTVQRRLVESARLAPSAPPTLPDGLTDREGEVLRLLAAGRTNAEIAAVLFVSEATVKTHINHIYAKTSSRDRAQAVSY